MKINDSQCSDDIKRILKEEKDILDLSFDRDGIQITASQNLEPGFVIEHESDSILIRYQKKTDFCRAMFTICGRKEQDFNQYKEKSSFEEFGVMLDLSRNAVMRTNQIKQYIRLAALMGYQFLGLYMEDTFEVSEEPYFGYMRGSMKAAELKEIDTYAGLFGIEIRAYIQTLAHLKQITRYEEYKEMIDTDDILLAGEERTYQFLEHLIKTISDNLSSRTVNIGMDEAHMLGLGKYLDKNGYSNRPKIMMKHLERVLTICRKYGLKAQMWSDMFFCLAYGGEFYKEEEELPADFPKIPEGVELFYWDYYSCDNEHYDKMLKRHLKLTDQIGFAGGAWKWTGFAPHNAYSMEIGKAAITACKENRIKSVVITAWGDNGAEASSFSILPALYADAEYNYTDRLDTAKFQVLTGMAFEDFMKVDLANDFSGKTDHLADKVTIHNNASKYLLYNDVFFGTFDLVVPEEIAERYKKASRELEKCSTNQTFGYLFDTQAKLCQVLKDKADLGIRIKDAYDRKNLEQLSRIVGKVIPQVLKELNCFYKALERQWDRENKPFGFEVQCIRIGGLQKRLEYAKEQLEEYVSGRRDRIEELEEDRKPFAYFKQEDINQLNYNLWHEIVTPSVIG